ncbi:MAG: peptidyl-prolyl cis-trans isomerase [Burkholderiales bacterium]|nr:peptidyl-prolyl cis-trans isomerase [Burkholderiales bacterium]
MTSSQYTRIARLIAAALLSLASVSAAAQDGDKPVATVNGKPIKQSTMDMAVRQATAQGNPDTPQLREAIKNQLIARELFVQEAAKQNLDKDAEVLAVAEEAKRTAMVTKYLRGQVKPAQITEEQAKTHYDQMKGNLGPRDYKLRVIMLPNDQRAKEVHGQIVKGKDFAEMARQWSLAPSSSRGGELEWVNFKTPAKEGNTQGLPLPLAQAVEKMQKGKVSEPIAVADRWWIVKLDDVRNANVPPFEQAKANIMRGLQQREVERVTTELATRLAKDAKIVAQ